MSNLTVENDCDGPLHPKAIEGLELFNHGQYWKAHEALEAAWRAESRPVRNLYKGILQAGVVYLHVTRKNHAGAVKVYQRCRKWLDPWPDICRDVAVGRLRQDLETVMREVTALGPDGLERFRPVPVEAGGVHNKLSEIIVQQNRGSMDEMTFSGKIALVTGSGRGIGRAIALHFARHGADVVVNFFRNRQPAETTAAEIEKLGRKALLVKADIGDPEDLKRLFDETEAAFGGLDIFVHNAASGYNRPAMEQKLKGWDWTMNINARSLLFAAQQAAALMEKRGGGSIVSLSSPGAGRVLPDYVVVGASKAAIESLTRYLAVELAPKNIVVNAVSPGIVETDALKHFASLSDGSVIQKAQAATPAGRLATPEDIAGVVGFLCTPAAAMIRGQVIVVDGGYILPAN